MGSEFHRDLIDVPKAAEILGVSKRRIQAMILQKCPECGGRGETKLGAACGRCHQTGRYLPAMRLGEASNSPWMIIRRDLQLVEGRTVGRRKKV